MKLKPTLWQQLLEDLHVLKQQIEASDTASREANAAGNSDILKLVLALENLDVDERVRLQIATAAFCHCLIDSHYLSIYCWCVAGSSKDRVCDAKRATQRSRNFGVGRRYERRRRRRRRCSSSC